MKTSAALIWGVVSAFGLLGCSSDNASEGKRDPLASQNRTEDDNSADATVAGGKQVRKDLEKPSRLFYKLGVSNGQCEVSEVVMGDVAVATTNPECEMRSYYFDVDVAGEKVHLFERDPLKSPTDPVTSLKETDAKEEKKLSEDQLNTVKSLAGDLAYCYVEAPAGSACKESYLEPTIVVKYGDGESIQVGGFASCNNPSSLCDGKGDSLEAVLKSLVE